jgi:hypothetical protein
MQVLRLLAAALALLGVAPLWRVLVDRPTGLAGAVTAAQASDHSGVLWSGLLLCAVPALLAVVLVDQAAFERLLIRIAAPLKRPRLVILALGLALAATLLAGFIALFILRGMPTLIDSFAQLVHARYIADGVWSGPITPNNEFWHIQQTVLTKHGWVSQYPPGHVVLLALGLRLGVVWLIGPLCWGVAVFFITLALNELLDDTLLARAAACFAALSPFSLALSGAFMSHIPAAACAAAALYWLSRARDGRWLAAAGAGVAIGILFTMRPLTAVALGAVAVGVSFRRSRVLATGFLGALPFFLLVGFYNNYFFGSPFQFGYHAALGPRAGLGFGIDPWGNQYGPLEAVGYTAAELGALSLYLFETPLPIVLLIGLYFATGKRTFGEWLLFGWAAAPVAANFFYWHHGLYMGPRMLADVGVIWGALAVVSVVGLIRDMRIDWRIARYAPRTFVTALASAAVVFGAVVLLPQRLSSYRVTKETRALLRAPELEEPALVFVHGGWTARVGMTLAAHGMRLDSVETALRQNPTCHVHAFADSFARNARPTVQLDFKPRAINLPPIAEMTPGNRIRVVANEKFDEGCATQIQADQGGIVDVTPFIWQGDLPGRRTRHALFVRDMGPAANRKLIAAQPERRALMLIADSDTVRLVPYAIAERAIWRSEP